MKQRLVVMNGSRIVQTEQGGKWHNDRVDKAGALKPGIYNIYLARTAEKSASHEGQVVHADKGGVYQKSGSKYVVHSPKDFDIVPAIGSMKSIDYDANGKALVSALTTQRARGRSR